MNRRSALLQGGALVSGVVVAAMTAGCAPASNGRSASMQSARVAPPDPPSALFAALRAGASGPPTVLALGEIHDNAVQHGLRLHWLQRLLERGGHFSVAMEQLDAANQSRIDALRAADAQAGRSTQARALAEAGGFSFEGWDWSLYEPVIAWALRHGLPVLGANLANAQTASIARGQPHELAQAQPAGWTDSDESSQRREISDAHCGVLPASVVPAMARAQRARDATMAGALQRALVAHRLPVVLLAGNGHVRRDLGVPRYLTGSGHAGPLLTVGFIERPASSAPTVTADPSGLYDWRVLTAAQARPDPCVGLRERMGSRGRALIDRAPPVGQ